MLHCIVDIAVAKTVDNRKFRRQVGVATVSGAGSPMPY